MSAESMFAESLLESGNVHAKGRGWATALSITIQSLLVAALVALPIFRPDALPTAVKSLTSPVAFGRPDLPRAEPSGPARPTAAPTERELVFIPADPAHDHPLNRDDAKDAAPPGEFMPRGRIGSPDGVRDVINTLIPVNPPAVAVRPPARVSISTLDPGRLIFQVQPLYPPLAKRAGVEGTVVLLALIDRDGRITGLQVSSGPALLQDAARIAVRQWRYRPYILNGLPVEVETQITVNFKLSR